MKKRVFAALLALALTLTLLPSTALALGAFADVTDANTARNVEVLRLMGVVSGDDHGDFRPRSNLTRAEFCKMAIELQGRGKETMGYRSRTIFPDVRPSHWAAGYINLASRTTENEPGLVHGFPDGSFQPGKTISYGEAVTVLMRVLGYTDKDAGAIWPQGYIDLAGAKGLTKGLTLVGSAAISRADAAQLFVNALAATTPGGGRLKTLGDETVLLSIDLAAGVMRTADGDDPKMANPIDSTYLCGLRGRVVYGEEKTALTFLPTAVEGSGSVVIVPGDRSGKAIIVAENGSTAGFEAMAGTRNYKIYRNGNETGAKTLRKYDVATWSSAFNAIIVCNTRLTVYYEAFKPTRTEPIQITALGGETFDVLPMAQQSVAQFHPGQQMVLLLTADGQVAGAVEPGTNGANSNAVGYVDEEGKVTMLCGGSIKPVGASAGKYAGQMVYISQSRDGVYFTPYHSSVGGNVDKESWTMGGYDLADTVLVLLDGKLTSLAALDTTGYPWERVRYARLNDAGLVDLIVIGKPEETGNLIYGRAIVDASDDDDSSLRTITVDCGARGQKGPFTFSNKQIMTGDYVSGEIMEREDGSTFLVGVMKLTCIQNVLPAAWIGTETVTANGKTYTVKPTTPCYCRDTRDWFGSVEKAIEYGGKMNLYIDKDGVVRAIECFD